MVTDIDTDAGMAVADALGGRFCRHDVASEADWAQVIEAIRIEFGRLDILVNDAGITLIGSIEDLSVDAFRRTLDVDLLGVFLGCKAGIALMKERGGAIVKRYGSIRLAGKSRPPRHWPHKLLRGLADLEIVFG